MKTLTAVLAVAAMASTAHADRMEDMTNAAAKSNAGDHGGAIALYEKAYLDGADPALLPIIGTEYRKAGLPTDAIDRFCKYLAVQPKGEQAPFSAMQVRQ